MTFMHYLQARKTAGAESEKERERERCRENLKWCDYEEGKVEVKDGGGRVYMSF